MTEDAGIGLIICSVITLSATTQGDVAGDPYFVTIRQSTAIVRAHVEKPLTPYCEIATSRNTHRANH